MSINVLHCIMSRKTSKPWLHKACLYARKNEIISQIIFRAVPFHPPPHCSVGLEPSYLSGSHPHLYSSYIAYSEWQITTGSKGHLLFLLEELTMHTFIYTQSERPSCNRLPNRPKSILQNLKKKLEQIYTWHSTAVNNTAVLQLFFQYKLIKN